MRLFCSWLFCLLVWLSPAAAQVPEDIQHLLDHRGHALLIGVSDYKAGWPQLPNVKNDLEELKAGFDPYFETVEIEQNPTVSKLRERMSEFLLDQWNKPDERLFIYYSGHGFTAFNQTSRDNDGYITGSDTPGKAVAKAVSFFDVDSWSRQTRARHVLMVFDSCFSGSLFLTMGPEPEPAPNFLDNVRTLLRRPMRYYITAGRQNEEVAADSTFAKLLLRGLRGGADKYHEGIISAEELGNYLYHEVPRFSARPQTPQYKSIGIATLSEGQFYFLTGRAAPTPLPFALPTPQAALAPQSVPAPALPRAPALLRTLTGHTSIVTSVAFSPDGRTLASGSYDKTIKLWDTASGQPPRTLTGNTSIVMSVAFSPDGHTLASGSYDQTIKLWDTASGQPPRTLISNIDSVNSVVFSPDGHKLSTGGFVNNPKDGRFEVWNLTDDQLARTTFTDAVNSIAFSPDGQTLAAGTNDKTIKLWDLASSYRQPRRMTSHSDNVSSVAFSLDGQTLASGSRDSTIKLWDVASGQLLRTLSGHADTVHSVAFSPDGLTLASGSFDKTIKLWDLASGQLLYTLTGHSGSVESITFSPDGHTLASGSNDKTIKLWDVSNVNEASK